MKLPYFGSEWVSGNPGQERGPLCEKSNVFGRQGLARPLCWSKLYGFDAYRLKEKPHQKNKGMEILVVGEGKKALLKNLFSLIFLLFFYCPSIENMIHRLKSALNDKWCNLC